MSDTEVLDQAEKLGADRRRVGKLLQRSKRTYERALALALAGREGTTIKGVLQAAARHGFGTFEETKSGARRMGIRRAATQEKRHTLVRRAPMWSMRCAPSRTLLRRPWPGSAPLLR